MGKTKTAILVLIFVILLPGAVSSLLAEDTMLMFVGQDLEVLTIASGKEEAAWSAPAIADVVTREDIENRNAATIAQALEGSPGFHINRTEKNSRIYMRGIPDSALVLFDTVPMGSGVVKSDIPIGYDTSLAAVKRIEVVRGSGSVLWGPDAFAGVVNVVPLSGNDFQGVQTGLNLSSLDDPGEAWLNLGRKEALWSGFLSISGRRANDPSSDINVVKFWREDGTAEPVETRYGRGDLDDSHYYNLYARLTFDDWLNLSVKLSDTKHAYSLANWERDYQWEEIQEKQTGMLKLEATHQIDPDSAVRFTGFVSGVSQEQTIVDTVLEQHEETWFGEVIYDRSLFLSKGLLTLGGSWRRGDYEDIPVWKNFYPIYFTPENSGDSDFGLPAFLPQVEQIHIANDLRSVFGQYRHDFEDIEVWFGVRYDGHTAYESKASFNAGLAWDLSPFVVKAVGGTGYRTPFARSLYDEEQGGGLEKITSLNLQVAWKSRTAEAAITLFHNEIENHVTEDRYSGYGRSDPNRQTIYGAELELGIQVVENLTLAGSLTLMDNSGPDESYYVPEAIDQYGNIVYKTLSHPYGLGPDIQAALKGRWKLSDHLILTPELRYFSSESLYNPTEEVSLNCDDAWIMDVNLTIKDLWPFDLTLYMNNITDETYLLPGVYSATDGPGFEAGMTLRMTW